MYASLIKEKFPHDESLDLFRAPHLPAVKLGKLLRRETRIASPSDVLGLHLWSGLLSSGYLVFTQDRCFFDGGGAALEDIRSAGAKGSRLVLAVNLQGQLSPIELNVGSEAAAQALVRFLEQIAYNDPKAEAVVANTYEQSGFDPAEINWLKLRDEVMRTIDMLYDRYNDGKLSILEFESKKEELLSRL